jgi:NO-binding membrane sensor protein with MHYT domain
MTCGVAEIHHFAYGWLNPVMAVVLAFSGSLTGLTCTVRARAAPTRARRARWLLIATAATGGTGIWLMHFMAMLGFDVPASPMRYDPVVTAVSLPIALLPVGLGLFVVGTGRRRTVNALAGGLLTGCGIVTTHYSGMYAVHVAGQISYDRRLVLVSALIGVIAATIALWLTLWGRGWRPLVAASATMAVGACGTHYTAMAAVRVNLDHTVVSPMAGLTPALLIVPIIIAAAVAVIAVFVSALQAMTEEEFGDRTPGPVVARAAPWRPATQREVGTHR